MAKVFVIGRALRHHYSRDVMSGGEPLPVGEMITIDKIEILVPSMGRMRRLAEAEYRLKDEGVYLLVHQTYNARATVSVDALKGLEEIFSYGDGHGMRWVGLFRVTDPEWSIDFSVPPHHGRGKYEEKRVRAEGESFIIADEERRSSEAPLV